MDKRTAQGMQKVEVFMKKNILLITLLFLLGACSQNAHLTKPDEGTTNANNGTNGKLGSPETPDNGGGNGSKPTSPNTGNQNPGTPHTPGTPNLPGSPGVEKPPLEIPTAGKVNVEITITSPSIDFIYFSARFTGKPNDRLEALTPTSTDSRSKISWDKVKKYIHLKLSSQLKNIQFDKAAWAQANNISYHLFDSTRTHILEENKRGEAKDIRLGLNRISSDGKKDLFAKIYPVEYLYAIDDEAVSQAQYGPKGDAFYTKGLAKDRWVRGLEYVSNTRLLYRNVNCSPGYDFVDTMIAPQRHNFQAQVVAKRNLAGEWIPYNQQNSESLTLLEAIGNAFSDKSASFSAVEDFGGNCSLKVQGLIILPKLSLEKVDGIQVLLKDQFNEAGSAAFGMTIMEAY